MDTTSSINALAGRLIGRIQKGGEPDEELAGLVWDFGNAYFTHPDADAKAAFARLQDLGKKSEDYQLPCWRFVLWLLPRIATCEGISPFAAVA
ncbi:MAG: hypothetical protein PHF00_10285 [Elusimicrobia bacterium]|nr:hypothetical protein [Elusimicrobiota bacterium]